MIVELVIVCLLAKIKHYKLKYLFNTWTFYPILAAQCIVVFLQASIIFRTYYFVQFVAYVEPAVILSFIFAIVVHHLYKPAVAGMFSVAFGTVLNKFVIAQNGGHMPVYPTLSYITGYLSPDMFGTMDSLHVLGGDGTSFKFLTDYIDYGYAILSPGDVFIHLFVCIMLYSLIKAVNARYGEIKIDCKRET